MSHAWDRQSYDTNMSYHAFGHYLELPLSERTIIQGYRNHKRICDGYAGDTSKMKVGAHWARWSAALNWIDRAVAYDEHRAEIRRLRRAEQLDKVMDDTASIARAGRVRVAQEIAALTPGNIPPGQLGHNAETIEYRRIAFTGLVSVIGIERADGS